MSVSPMLVVCLLLSLGSVFTFSLGDLGNLLQPNTIASGSPGVYSANDVDRAFKAIGFRNMPISRAQTLLNEMKKESWFNGEQEMFLATLAAETGGFQHLEESQCVTDPRTKCAVYGHYDNAQKRWVSYHGRGYIQLTGKPNYAEMGKISGIGEKQLLDHPEMLLDERTAAMASVLFWKKSVIRRYRITKRNDEAEPSMETVTKYVNGAGAPASRIKQRCRYFHIITQTVNPALFRTLDMNECN